MDRNPWPEWAEKIRAIAQNGITYTDGNFDLERYKQLQDISHQMVALLADAPASRVDNYFLPEKGYTTPKLDIRAGIFKDNTVLLVRERDDNCWSLPGGWADAGEPPSTSVEREVLEESGYIAKTSKLVAVKDTWRHPYHPKNPHHILKMLFLCELEGGSPKENIEISEINFFPIDQLPTLSEGRTLTADIHLLHKHYNNPDLATLFD